MPRSSHAARRATAHPNRSLPRRPDAALFPGYHLVGAPTASASGSQLGPISALWPIKLEATCSGLVFGFGPSWRHEHLYDNTSTPTTVKAWLLVTEDSGLITRHVLTFDGEEEGTIPPVVNGTPKVASPPIVSDPLEEMFTPDTEAYLVVVASSPVGQNVQLTRTPLLKRGERGYDQVDVLQAVNSWSAVTATNIWTVSGHGFVVGQRLVVLNVDGGSNIQQGQKLWVNQVIDANQFTVSTSLHGATLTITGAGATVTGTAWQWPGDHLVAPIKIGVLDELDEVNPAAIAAGVSMISTHHVNAQGILSTNMNTQPDEALNLHAERTLMQVKADNNLRVIGHGWPDYTPVVICKPNGSWSVGNISVGTTYYVLPPSGATNTPTSDWLRLSLVGSGSTAIDITGTGGGANGVIAPAESVIKFTVTAGSTTCTRISGDPVGGDSQLKNGDELLICQLGGSVGLDADGRVFVRSVSGFNFEVCHLPGGDPIAMTAPGTILAVVEEKVEVETSQHPTRIHLKNATRHQHAAISQITWQGQGVTALAPTFIAAKQISANSVGGIVAVGDSLTDDKPGLGTQPRGWLDIAGERDGISIQNIARQGEYVEAFMGAASAAPRHKLIKTARWMTEMGTNDMGGGKNFATLQTLKRQFWQDLGIDNGLRVIACIPPPRTGNGTSVIGSPNNWETVEDQVRFDGWEDLRVELAAWLRGMVTEWVGPTDSILGRGIMGRCDNNSEAPSWVFDLGAALESSLDSGKYRLINGKPSVRDGIHPTDRAHAYLASLLNLNLLNHS